MRNGIPRCVLEKRQQEKRNKKSTNETLIIQFSCIILVWFLRRIGIFVMLETAKNRVSFLLGFSFFLNSIEVDWHFTSHIFTLSFVVSPKKTHHIFWVSFMRRRTNMCVVLTLHLNVNPSSNITRYFPNTQVHSLNEFDHNNDKNPLNSTAYHLVFDRHRCTTLNQYLLTSHNHCNAASVDGCKKFLNFIFSNAFC